MAATDARPVPRKNAAWRVYFAVRKNDGTLITTWAGQDSEVSLDGAAFADCTNEATEVGTSGCGYLDLTSSEMNADEITLKITVTNTDALPLVLTVFPEEAGDYRVADTQKVDVETIKTQSVTAAAGITIPASIASPTNITAATGIVLSGVTHTGAVIPTVSTLSGHTAQTGDSFARIGVNGAGLTTLATAAQIAAMTVNTRANYQVPIEIELPDSSTQVFKIRLHLFDSEGNMEAPDSTPTIALTNAAGTDRSSRLSAASNPSTGVYSWDYTATAGDAEEQLVWVFTVVEGALTRTYPATSYVVEESAYRFSSTDRATLNAAATQVSVNDVPTVAEFEARTLAAASYATAAAIAAEAVKTAAIKATTDQLTFTTPNKVDSTAVLDPAARVKLDATQPDYVPATAASLAAAKAILDKIDSGLVADGLVYQFTANMLELGPSGGGGGSSDWTADERAAIRAILGIPGSGTAPADPTVGILDTIRDLVVAYIAAALATVNGTSGTIVGFPTSLNIGDSYTDEANASIHVFIRDASDDPITAVGDFEFTDPEFAPEVTITQSGSTGRVKAVVTYVDPGAPESYLKIEIPSSQSKRAAPGTATIQCLLKWVDDEGKVLCQKTLSKQAVTWNEMV